MKAYLKRMLARTIWRYDSRQFVDAVRALGISPGDVLMVHASWSTDSGFSGRPVDLVHALQQTAGDSGLLCMPSLTYQNESTREFLARGIAMNVRRSPSKMGLLSEVFRRGREVHRSLSPTHPVLARGLGAEAFVAGHESCLVPFGEGSPFHRLLERDAKILCINASFATVTFTHYLEDRIAAHLPFPLYEPEPMQGIVIDHARRELRVPVRVISAQAHALRREARLVAALEREGLLRRARIGNSRLLLLSCREMTRCVDHMTARGELFFDAPDP